ncbi:MAG: 2TM domain-containing protein [Chloroflexota bacterium]
MGDSPGTPRSFAETSLAGEDERRRAEQFPRPARAKFRRHLALFLIVNLVLAAVNLLVAPDHLVFYYLTIVWAFVLGDNFLWAFVVDPDRDVAERKALREARERWRAEPRDGQDRPTPGSADLREADDRDR